MKATYDVTKSTKWNRENGPIFDGEIPERKVFEKKTRVWDFEVNSPIGVPAGPLFNSKFVKLYGELGFDVLVYKTVRSVERIAHGNPNIVFVDGKQISEESLGGGITTVGEPEEMQNLTITNSFGINSLLPEDWQRDFALAKSYLKDDQLLIMSATSSPGCSERGFKEDFVYTAALAKDAGADAVVLNFSCPNLGGGAEGAVYLDPEASADIAGAVKKELKNTPLIIKLGYYPDESLLEKVIAATAGIVDGIGAINTIKMKVYKPDGTQALPGEGRLTSGLCGAALKPYSVKTISALARLKREKKYDFEIFGTGGVVEARDFDDLLAAGATVAMSGAGSMWNPYLAAEWGRLRG